MRNKLHTINVVFSTLGSLLFILGAALLLPIVVGLICGEIEQGLATWYAFLVPAAVAMALGLLFSLFFPKGRPDTKESMLICSLVWLVFSALGALPFVFALQASFLDSFFETMSGFTTTGITMFRGLDNLPKSIIFWRALTQWIGGLGILTLFLAVLYRKGSAHLLFDAESHKIEAVRPVPGLANTIKILWFIYCGFTLFIITLLVLAGMSLFDSICHSFTALSTGGFSPYDASIGYYQASGYVNYVLIEYIIILAMILGGTNFLVHYRVIKGDIKAIGDTSEMRYWWGCILVFVILIFVERVIKIFPLPPFTENPLVFWQQVEKNFRAVLFQTTAILTTTGFSTEEIGSPVFGFLARQLFLLMMIIGGCVGSTGGGIKMFRVSVLIKVVKREVFRLHIPRRAVSPLVIDGKVIPASEIIKTCGIFISWIMIIIIGGCVTALLSAHDAVSSFSGMCSALGNIGPCYIPAQEMSQLHPVIKIVYIFGMLAGRLEILPVLLLFKTRSWI